jgi:hypothetical protein
LSAVRIKMATKTKTTTMISMAVYTICISIAFVRDGKLCTRVGAVPIIIIIADTATAISVVAP